MNNLDILAAAIVRQAVDDWRMLIKKKRVELSTGNGTISFIEIRSFLKSGYCRGLLKTDPIIILNQLEQELRK